MFNDYPFSRRLKKREPDPRKTIRIKSTNEPRPAPKPELTKLWRPREWQL